MSLALGMERSEAGMLYAAPALLTKMSRSDSLLTQAAIEESDWTSNVSVSMPRDATCVILEGFRAVAKTCRPASWKAIARAAPRPPSEQPVIRTVRSELEIFLSAISFAWVRSSRIEITEKSRNWV